MEKKIEATIRVRMSKHDAHYAGDLVDGAKILNLFGDVATELLIKLDGDEGLFKAYESVEFMAQVVAGDYIEARGKIVEIGNTSRTMMLEAWKVISPDKQQGRTAAKVLDPPVLVCRANGVCVTPKSKQRFKHGK